MARVARADAVVDLDPERALALWRDVRRWSGFVEGFQRVDSLSEDWPGTGAKVVWASGAGGRGVVTEKVVESPEGGFATRVNEERLHGVQTVQFEDAGDGRALARLALEYELASENPLRGLTDVLFIRRALRDMLRRTLQRFAIEAAEDAALSGPDSVTG